MKFSIIIPAFDQQDYLPDAIESALNQTVQSEVIVVIDGSPDHSKEIANRYPVRVINQVNKGLPSARNTGIMAMTGDVFLPLDADDILQDTCIEVLQKVFEETGADIVAPSFKCFGRAEQSVILMPNPTIEDFKTANRIGYFSAIRRESLIECGGYSPKMVWGYEDLHLWHDLLSRGKRLVTISDVLVLYRMKEKSMMNIALAHDEELKDQIRKDFPQLYESAN